MMWKLILRRLSQFRFILILFISAFEELPQTWDCLVVDLLHLRYLKHSLQPGIYLSVFLMVVIEDGHGIGLSKLACRTQVSYSWLGPIEIGSLVEPILLHQTEGPLEDYDAFLYGLFGCGLPSQRGKILSE